MDRRAGFFLGAAIVCFLLVPVSEGYAWVSATVGAVYVIFAVASWLEAREHRETRPLDRPPTCP